MAREGRTPSVCPVCMKRIPAERVKTGNDVYLKKRCAEHGDFSTIIWRGDSPEFDMWWDYNPPAKALLSDCPNDCGLCGGHLNKTCCALVEVTSRCNLKCPVCFAKSGGSGTEPDVPELYETFLSLSDAGNTFVQLSGGEPTVRSDLAGIIAAAKKAGIKTIQLNSNGLRLGREKGYAKTLADAGLSFVFMQFDSVTNSPYRALRGENLLDDKLRAIDECGIAGLGVTLVPTLVPNVNIDEVGAIVELGISFSPVVRGVHFQPVSYFGRYPEPPRDADRITLPEVLTAIESQTGGKFKISDFVPSSCDHPRCGFHGDFVVLGNGKIMKLTKKYDPEACCSNDALKGDAHLKNRAFVARRWTRSVRDERSTVDISGDAPDMSAFLSRVKSHGFTVTAMAFQDVWTLELERLRKCSLHVMDSGKTVPFCARYITSL